MCRRRFVRAFMLLLQYSRPTSTYRSSIHREVPRLLRSAESPAQAVAATRIPLKWNSERWAQLLLRFSLCLAASPTIFDFMDWIVHFSQSCTRWCAWRVQYTQTFRCKLRPSSNTTTARSTHFVSCPFAEANARLGAARRNRTHCALRSDTQCQSKEVNFSFRAESIRLLIQFYWRLAAHSFIFSFRLFAHSRHFALDDFRPSFVQHLCWRFVCCGTWRYRALEGLRSVPLIAEASIFPLRACVWGARGTTRSLRAAVSLRLVIAIAFTASAAHKLKTN